MNTIKIAFSLNPTVNQTLTFQRNDYAGGVQPISFTFVTVRQFPGQVTIGTNLSATVANFLLAFAADRNFSNQYTVTQSGTDVTIGLSDAIGFWSTPNPSTAPVTFTVTNAAQTFPLTWTYLFQTGDCDNINLQFLASGGLAPYDLYDNNILYVQNFDPSTTVSLARGYSNQFFVIDANGVQSTKQLISVPRKYVAADFNIDILQTPNGATVTIQTVNPVTSTTPLTYSLNAVDYVSNSVFEGVISGSYTAYIKDKYGCITGVAFTVTGQEENPTNAINDYLLVSEANSIRFSEVNGLPRNYYNSLSCKEAVNLPYKTYIEFDRTDVVRTQVKSNYSETNVRLVNKDLTEDTIILEEIVTNIGLKDSRDCKTFELPASQTGVYFDGGSTYDYDTGIANGTYSLDSGLLPIFVTEGVFLNITDLGWQEVVGVAYDEIRAYWYAILSVASTGNDVARVCSTVYNRQPYNVYEFSIPMTTYDEFLVLIEGKDGGTVLKSYVSEWCRVNEQTGGVVVEWSDTENRAEMVWATGITSMMRIPHAYFTKLSPESTIESYNTDDRPVLTKSLLYKNISLEAYALSTAMAYKLLLGLMFDKVRVNGLDVTVKEVEEFERLGRTNLYKMAVTVIEGGNEIARQNEENVNLTILSILSSDFEGSPIVYN